MTKTINNRFVILFALVAAFVGTNRGLYAQGDLQLPIDEFGFSVPQPIIGEGVLTFEQVGPNGCFMNLFGFEGNDAGDGRFFVPGVMDGGPILEPTPMDFDFPIQWSRMSDERVMVQAQSLFLDFEAPNAFNFPFITHYDWHFWIIIIIDFNVGTFDGFYESDDPLTDKVETLQLISPDGETFYSGVAAGEIAGRVASGKVVPGDVNGDGQVNLLDVQPFVDLLTTGGFSPAADINQDGSLDLLDVAPFVALLSGN